MANTAPLLVHGAWHGSWCWGHVRPGLEEAEFSTHTVDLSSHGEETATWVASTMTPRLFATPRPASQRQVPRHPITIELVGRPPVPPSSEGL